MAFDLEKVTALRDEIDALRERLLSATKEMLRDGVPEFFEEYGDIVHSFGWVQYAPSFNDGDPCYFSKHELFIIANADFDAAIEESGLDLATADEYDIRSVTEEAWEDECSSPSFNSYRGKSSETVSDYSSGSYKEVPNPDFDPRYGAAEEAAAAIYNAIDEDTAKDIFGEYAKVIISPSGVETADYEPPY